MDKLELKFETRLLTRDDEEEVIDLIKNYYSPFAKCVYGEATESLEEFQKLDSFRVKLKLEQNYCLGVFERSTNDLISVALNTVQTKTLDPTVEDFESYGIEMNGSNAYRTRLYYEIEKDVFDILGTDRIFYEGMGTTHTNYRRLHLAQYLGKKSVRMALQSGCEYIVGKSSSSFLVKNLGKMGLSILKEIDLSEYVDSVTGIKPYPRMSPPYTHVRLYYMKLHS